MTQTTYRQLNIGFIGAGNMAAAIARGLLKQGHSPQHLKMSNRSQEKLIALQEELGIGIAQDNQQLVNQSDLVIIAVKPQTLRDAIEPLDCRPARTIISVAAGINTRKLKQLTQHHTVIRAMPNTPALELCGATGLYADSDTRNQSGALAEYVFGAVGTYQWIDNENLMDTVTAIAGSSPAYFFRFMEGLIEAAKLQGMPETTARALVVQSALGAATLIARHPDIPIATRRQQVTSPGGTTAAALQVFEDGQLMALVESAVQAAVERGQQLAQE